MKEETIKTIYCPGCRTELAVGTKFCPYCKYEFKSTIRCARCGANLLHNAEQCTVCSASPTLMAANKQLINWSWFSEAWRLFNKCRTIWIASGLVVYLPILMAAILFSTPSLNTNSQNTGNDSSATIGPIAGFVLCLATFLLQIILNHTTSVIANKQVRGEPVTFSDLFRYWPSMWSMLGYNVCCLILFYFGLFLFVVPAICVVAFLAPGMALIADGISVGDSLRHSFTAMKRDPIGAILFALAWNALVMVSAIPCGIGLLVTLPMVNILMALIYRDVIGSNNVLPSETRLS